MRHKLVLVGVLAGACGAASDDGGARPDAAPARLEIGSSFEGYQPLLDGGTLLLYHGPQGGYHVYLGLRASGVAPGTPGELPRLCTDPARATNPCVDFEVKDLDTDRVVDTFVGLRLALTASTASPGSYELIPPRLVQVTVTSFEELEGHRLRVSAVVDDKAGVHVEEVVTATCVAVR